MSIPVADVVTHYFEAGARRDIDAIVALFTDETVIVETTLHAVGELNRSALRR